MRSYDWWQHSFKSESPYCPAPTCSHSSDENGAKVLLTPCCRLAATMRSLWKTQCQTGAPAAALDKVPHLLALLLRLLGGLLALADPGLRDHSHPSHLTHSCRAPTGCTILTATPKFPYVPESRKKRSPKLATPWNDLSPRFATPKTCPELATPKLPRVVDSAFFGGGKSWTLSFQGVASSGLIFSGFWLIMVVHKKLSLEFFWPWHLFVWEIP